MTETSGLERRQDVEVLSWPSQILDRVTGTAAEPGHRIQLLRDSHDHEPATLALIAAAQHHLCLEHYLLRDDAWGAELLDALVHACERGVTVRVLVDWLGSGLAGLRRWRRRLEQAGGHFRYFNPPGLGEPLAWVVRNHRKLISRDGVDAIISGWCLSAQWRGKPGSGPWRDTGIWISGPLVADAEQAFAESWALSGDPDESRIMLTPWISTDPTTSVAPRTALAPLDPVRATPDSPAHPVMSARARLLVGRPQDSPVYALDQLVYHLARESIWLTDAYPVATPAWRDSLRRAARAGLDVRLLVPGSSDLPLVGLVSRSSYRSLLESGVRIFEWNGPMLHAKTVVIDGQWCRIGSSNQNPASWLGNYELDVAIEDAHVGHAMQQQYIDDLAHATEMVLNQKQQVQLVSPRTQARRGVSPGQAPATTVRLSRALALTVRESRVIGPTDAVLLSLLAGLGLLFAGLAWWKPDWVAWSLAVLSGWISLNLLRIAARRYRRHRAHGRPRAPSVTPPDS